MSFRWGYLGEDLVAEWGGIVTVRVTRGGDLKALDPSPNASRELVEKMRCGAVRAFMRAQRKQHSLHASAVAIGGRGLAFVGASGLGKSTVAASLCREADAAFLADDVTAVEVLADGAAEIVPTESAVWLAADASEVKVPRRPSRLAVTPAPLRWIVALAFHDDFSKPEMRDLHGGDAVSALLPSIIRFETTHELWVRELDFLERIVSQCRVVRMTRARCVGADAVTHALRELASEGPR
jgi:hypothetical protein